MKTAPNIPSRSILPLLGRIFQEMTCRSNQRWNLPPNCCIVLGHLDACPEVCEPAAVAEATRLPRQTMTFILDTLETRGLAVRRPHPRDRRRKTIRLSPAGRKLARAIRRDFLSVEQAALAGSAGAGLEPARRHLSRLAEAFARMNRPPPSSQT